MGYKARRLQSVERWNKLESLIRKARLGWGVHRLPPTLRVARSAGYPRGVKVEHLFPDKYLSFVARLDYPVIGFSYMCQLGFSMLPPEHIAAVSPILCLPDGDTNVEDPGAEVPSCRFAFFAGSDLSDLSGFAFGAAATDNSLKVWRVSNAMLAEEVGTFSEWLNAEADRLTNFVSALSDRDIDAMKVSCEGEVDPHRALDYALHQDKEHSGFSAADLKLHWVESQETYSRRYGLIHSDGHWLMPMGQTFDFVSPFRGGRALVGTKAGRISINSAGKKLADRPLPQKKQGTNELMSKGKRFGFAGAVTQISVWELKEHIKRIKGKFVGGLSTELDFIIIGNCKSVPMSLKRANDLARQQHGLVLLSEKEFLKETGHSSCS